MQHDCGANIDFQNKQIITQQVLLATMINVFFLQNTTE